MKLHEDKKRFVEAITAASTTFGIEPALVEKDYFVTLFLQKAMERIPGLVFKGGTSLSKCYKLIDRFSEDIDLTLDNEHFTQSKKRNSIKELIAVCDELGLELLNREAIEQHTHGNFNCYDVRYPILFPSEDIKTELKVEMTYIQKSYPHEQSQASSYIGEFFQRIGNSNIVAEYGLESFAVQVQSLERTLIDKVFAVCDYYLSGNTVRNSRHIYDISKLLTRVNISDCKMKALVKNVRNERKPNKTCLSAQDGADVPALLEKIIAGEFFKQDYDERTLKLLTNPVSYDDAIKSLDEVIASGLFIESVNDCVEQTMANGKRGPETLVGLRYISVFEEAREHYKSRPDSHFEDLYYGNRVLSSEEKDEEQLMLYLIPFCEGDKERLMRVFKSSWQYRDAKPTGYYDDMADRILKLVVGQNQQNPVEDKRMTPSKTKKDINSK